MTDDIDLTLAGTDPAAFVLAVADLREARANAATPGPWVPYYCGIERGPGPDGVLPAISICDTGSGDADQTWPDAEHIAAEADPAHVLAAIRHWRGTVERHRSMTAANVYQVPAGMGVSDVAPYPVLICRACRVDPNYPCPDLLAVVAAAKAYLTGGAS